MIQVNSFEDLKHILARDIMLDTVRGVEHKYEFQNWRNSSHLIEISEHGYELSDYSLENEDVKFSLIGVWSKNRWGEPNRKYTASQIARKLRFDLQAEVAEKMSQHLRSNRNNARHAIHYHLDKISQARQEMDEYLAKYDGRLPDLPMGCHLRVEYEIIDQKGNIVKVNLDDED